MTELDNGNGMVQYIPITYHSHESLEIACISLRKYYFSYTAKCKALKKAKLNNIYCIYRFIELYQIM